MSVNGLVSSLLRPQQSLMFQIVEKRLAMRESRGQPRCRCIAAGVKVGNIYCDWQGSGRCVRARQDATSLRPPGETGPILAPRSTSVGAMHSLPTIDRSRASIQLWQRHGPDELEGS